MTRITLASLIASVSIFTSSAAYAAPLALWNFNDSNATVDTSAPGVTATAFTGGNPNTGGGGVNLLTITNFEARGGSDSTAVNSATTPYWQVTLSSASRLVLEGLVFGARVFQQPGLRNGFVDVRVDTGSGFGSALPPTPFEITAGALNTVTVPLGFTVEPGNLFTTRFYLLNDPTDLAPNLIARLALDNVQFNGTVPAPSTLALAGAAGLGLLFGAARRRRAP